MCQGLGIEIIAASSPQAKGRVERNHGTHQDRLVKKLRRKGLTRHAAVNEYLEKEYLPEHNRRFARAAAEKEDYHRRKPSHSELHQIFRLETERRISNDWVVRHEGRFLQLQPKHRYGPTQAKALVCEWEDGTTEVYYRGERLAYQELSDPPSQPSVKERVKETVLSVAKPRQWKPSQDHPWRRGYRTMKPNGPAQLDLPARLVARKEASL